MFGVWMFKVTNGSIFRGWHRCGRGAVALHGQKKQIFGGNQQLFCPDGDQKPISKIERP